jgi:hypothetical protein
MAKFGTLISRVHFLVVLVVVLEYSATMAFADVPWADVNIYHAIPGPDRVRVDCVKSRPGKSHHIFTPVTLVFGQHFGWGFKPSIWGLTKYDCQFIWVEKNYSRTLTVWIDYTPFVIEPVHRPCTYCLWNLAPNGIYRLENNVTWRPVGDLNPWRFMP